jgi:hypothetical protein
MHGTNTLEIEVTNISTFGFWLFIKDKEYFLPFKYFPWFAKFKIEDIIDVKLLHNKHLYWEKLDIDLDIKSIEHPEKYPLVSSL